MQRDLAAYERRFRHAGLPNLIEVYYAIAVLTDATYREEFLEDIVGQLRETFRLRTEYLTLRGSSPRT
jgi:hypothetical protein